MGHPSSEMSVVEEPSPKERSELNQISRLKKRIRGIPLSEFRVEEIHVMCFNASGFSNECGTENDPKLIEWWKKKVAHIEQKKRKSPKK